LLEQPVVNVSIIAQRKYAQWRICIRFISFYLRTLGLTGSVYPQ